MLSITEVHTVSIPSIRANVANMDIVHMGKPTVQVKAKGAENVVQGPSHALKLTPQISGLLRYKTRGKSVPHKPGVNTFRGNFWKHMDSEELAHDFCTEEDLRMYMYESSPERFLLPIKIE